MVRVRIRVRGVGIGIWPPGFWVVPKRSLMEEVKWVSVKGKVKEDIRD